MEHINPPSEPSDSVIRAKCCETQSSETNIWSIAVSYACFFHPPLLQQLGRLDTFYKFLTDRRQFHVACSQLEPENENYSSALACCLQSPGISTRALCLYYLSTWHVLSTNNALGSTANGRRPSSGLKCSQLFCNLIIVHDKPQTVTLKIAWL